MFYPLLHSKLLFEKALFTFKPMTIMNKQKKKKNEVQAEGNDLLQAKPLSKKWLTQQEALEYLQVGKTTLKTYRDQGLVVCSKMRGRLRFNEDDLHEAQVRARR